MAQTTTLPLTLESNGVAVALDGTPDLDSFAAAANAKARIKGLDDELNPGIIDPPKLRGMVAALPAQKDDVRAAMAGHTLLVASPGFGVLAIEPTRSDVFGLAYQITIRRVGPTYVQATSNAEIDPAQARIRAAAAKAAVGAADKAVQAAEKGRPDPDGMELGELRWRRAQAAVGWRLIARAWVAAAPQDHDAARALAAAEKAADAFDMPSGARL